jgi:DNA-binding transcriptional LysR family regulator
MTTVDLNRIATFVKVVDAGSFTGAAERLGVPKSSVSRGVAHLEEELGTRLLQRTTRSLTLTDAGRAFYERARAHLAALEDTTNEIADMGRDPRGTVRVTAPVDFGTVLLADIVARFVKKHPKIRVELALTARRVDLVAEGFDLAIRFGSLEDSTLVARRLGPTSMGLFAGAAYLRKRGTPKKVQDLASHDFILFRSRAVMSPLRLRGPDGDEMVHVDGPVEADDITFIRAAVVAGAGIGLLPMFLCGAALENPRCREAAEAGSIVRVLPEHVMPGAPAHIVTPSTRQEPARATLFREFLVDALKNVKWEGVSESG